MTIRVGLDLLSLGVERTGMAAQAWWLARRMPELAPDVTFVFFLPPGVPPPIEAPNVEVVRVRFGDYRGARLVAEQWHLPRAAARARLDLLHTIAYGPPALYRGLKILTVHDLALWVMPETAPARFRRYWRWAYENAGRTCPALIAVSEATRRDACRFLHRRPDEVFIVQCGVDPQYAPTPSDHDPWVRIRNLNLPDRFVLSVGTIQPRKDLVTLLDAFARLAARDADLHLVIVGGRGWGYDDPERMIADRKLSGRVHLAGFVGQDDMPDIYRAARLLLFTSRYEGFGLPLLEAMASGTPVVATRTSSVPEVVGAAALLAEVGDAAGLAEAAGRILADDGVRRELALAGLARARDFSWERSAAATIEVYRRVMASESR